VSHDARGADYGSGEEVTMPDWLFWFLLGVLLLGVEAVIAFTLYAGAVSFGAFPAAIVAALGASLEVQVAVFAVGAAFSLIVLRPIARRQLELPQSIRTGSDALIGARATVVRTVDEDGGTVKIKGGDVWSARALMPTESFEAGAEVVVREIRGAAVLVTDLELGEG
jgi:membrane protein implicated in regulation of membrane protease activity